MHKFVRLAAIVAAIAALPALPARAGGCTVTTTPSFCVPAKSTGYRLVAVSNEGGASVCVTDDGTVPVCGAAGTYTIPAGATRVWEAANVTFGAGVRAVASSGTVPVTYTAQ
jgi:hypothetical protein